MKYFVKKSVLLLLVVLAFCACDNSNDNGEIIQPNPQSSKTVVNYTGEVEFVVDAPQIREDIEQDLKANHQLVVTLEDGSKDGGFGERIASYYGTSEMKVMVGGIRKGLYDRYDVQQLLSDNRLLDEQIVEDILLVIND